MKLETVVLNRERNVTLRAYLLDTPADYENIDKSPAVLVLPGGAYMRCSNREAEPVAMAFLAEGYNAYILNYSVMEHAEFPHPLEDPPKGGGLEHRPRQDRLHRVFCGRAFVRGHGHYGQRAAQRDDFGLSCDNAA